MSSKKTAPDFADRNRAGYDDDAHRPKRRVLVVDDDPSVREMLIRVLVGEGYLAAAAADGAEALKIAAAAEVDLVLLDLNMPVKSGWDTFERLTAENPLVPVIIITARPHQYKEAVRLGVDAFMEKPLNISILVRAIKRLTSEDENRHVRRITSPAFVTRLLDSADA
jgi:DNA-binding response OmpR family regulator